MAPILIYRPLQLSRAIVLRSSLLMKKRIAINIILLKIFDFICIKLHKVTKIFQEGKKKMTKRTYIRTWRNKWITSGAQSIDDFIEIFESNARHFRQWKEWGIQLLDLGGVGDDYAMFGTDDMETAVKAGFLVYKGDDRETVYLELLGGETVRVPEEILKKYKNS